MSSLYAIRTMRALTIVDAPSGLMIYVPFTITPAGQPGWEPAAMTVGHLDDDEPRPITDPTVLADVVFSGGILRRRDDNLAGEVILWCVPVHATEFRPTQADVIIAGGFVFYRGPSRLLSRMQPDGRSVRSWPTSAWFDVLAGDALAFRYPRAFTPREGGHETESSSPNARSEEDHVTLLMTASGSVHAIHATGRWAKITSGSGRIRAGWGEWRTAQTVTIPRAAVEAATTLKDAVQHPDARPGIHEVQPGDHVYLSTRTSWTLTTPIVRVLSGVLTDTALSDEGACVVAGADRAWFVENGMLLPIHDGDVLPAPTFLAVGDCVANTLITHAVRLDETFSPHP